MMKPTKQQLAIFGLYLSLSAALVSGGLYVVQRSFSLPLQISLALTIVGITAFVLLDPVRAQAALTGRQARYGSNALLKTLAFIGILIVLNYLAFQNSPRWDLTENREHTLTPETIDTLQSLSAPVTAKAFFTSRSAFSIDDTRKILESYQAAGKGNFNYQFIDPEADPVAAQKANISREGTIVLEMEDRQEQVTFTNEQEITSALIRLANPSERVVYFLTGRGEFDPKGSGEHSFSLLNQSLEQKNYVVKTLNLLINPVIPDDALAIIIARAQKAYSPNEISLIQEYVSNGGSLVVLAEPVMGDSIEDNFGLYEYLEQTWGIAPEDDVIIDPNVNPPLIAISDSYGSHPITERLMNRATIFPTVRSIRTTGEGNLPRQELIFTSPMSWGET
ncbi:MAG: GldG family protein, partial [Anaerolineaceae bacterium]|nr:GldG family protein [Anaerolineaceae bacterium]